MGLTVVDAGVVIGFLDAKDAHHEAAARALADALGRHDRIVLPASAFAEALVGPTRRGARAVSLARSLVARLPIQIAPLDEQIARAAAALRARHPSLRLPDGLVIATARTLDADVLVTTDRGWPTQAELGLRASVLEL